MQNCLTIVIFFKLVFLAEFKPDTSKNGRIGIQYINFQNVNNCITDEDVNILELENISIIEEILYQLEEMDMNIFNQYASNTKFYTAFYDSAESMTYSISFLGMDQDNFEKKITLMHNDIYLSEEPYKNIKFVTNKLAFFALAEFKIIKFFYLQLSLSEKNSKNAKLLSFLVSNLQKYSDKFVNCIEKNTRILIDQFDSKLNIKSYDYTNFEMFKIQISNFKLKLNMIDHYISYKELENSNITEKFMLRLISFDFLNYIQSEMLNSTLEKKQPNSNDLKYLDKLEYCKTDFSLDNLQANHKKCFVFSIDFAQFGIKNMLNYLKLTNFNELFNCEPNSCLHVEINLNFEKLIINWFKEKITKLHFSDTKKSTEDIYFFMKTLEQVLLYSCLIDTSDIHFLEGLQTKNVEFHILQKSLDKNNFKIFTCDLKEANISISKTRRRVFKNSIRNFVNSIFKLLKNSIEKIIIKKADCDGEPISISNKQKTDSNSNQKKRKLDEDLSEKNIFDSTSDYVKIYVKSHKALCSCLIDIFKIDSENLKFFNLKKYTDYEDNSLFDECMKYAK
ncbi:hypothetical protein GVAV_002648 [Gurleya vavrai]